MLIFLKIAASKKLMTFLLLLNPRHLKVFNDFINKKQATNLCDKKIYHYRNQKRSLVKKKCYNKKISFYSLLFKKFLGLA